MSLKKSNSSLKISDRALDNKSDNESTFNATNNKSDNESTFGITTININNCINSSDNNLHNTGSNIQNTGSNIQNTGRSLHNTGDNLQNTNNDPDNNPDNSLQSSEINLQNNGSNIQNTGRNLHNTGDNLHNTGRNLQDTDNDPDKSLQISENSLQDPNKRNFLDLVITGFGCIGTACAIYPFLSSFNPAKDTVANSTIEIDLTEIQIGATKVFSWQGKPIFVRHRTKEEILLANEVEISILKDSESDATRVKRPEWLIVIGICTHLGCVPKCQKNGWLCPCHGSRYDTSGRIISGPAPTNLAVPPYEFISSTLIKIG